jgi:hypothetical protein
LRVNVPEGQRVSLFWQQIPCAPPDAQRYLWAMSGYMANPDIAQRRAQCMQTAFREARGRVSSQASMT